MFNPLDFLKVAEMLARRDGGEASFSIPEDYRVHKITEEQLKKYYDMSAGYKLGGLRRMRGKADYELNKSISRKEAQKAIEIAKDIIRINRVMMRCLILMLLLRR
ncbi:MAG: hypothetical protein ACXQTS_05890, partial [Candidatus Methanospirareceae archaeon]